MVSVDESPLNSTNTSRGQLDLVNFVINKSRFGGSLIGHDWSSTSDLPKAIEAQKIIRTAVHFNPYFNTSFTLVNVVYK